MMNVMPLMGLLNKKLVELTDVDIRTIVSVVAPGVIVNDEVKSVIMRILATDNIDTLADIISRPDIIKALMVAVMPPPPSAIVRQCGHCSNFMLVEL